MLIYLADLVHNYLRGSNTVPLNIAYIAAYAKLKFGDKIEIRLFKYANELLDAVDKKQPVLVGLSNYTWNYRLNEFVGRYIKQNFPQTIVVMGGPNIRLDNIGIAQFLKENSYVDVYCLLEGEILFSRIIEKLLDPKIIARTSEFIRSAGINSCFSLVVNKLTGHCVPNNDLSLDYIPSPYLSGILDPFLKENLIPLIETNRGCPYSCAYCNWGVSAHNKLKQFSLERVKSEMDYLANKRFFPYWIIADANFGILERDIDIAKHLHHLYKKKRPFSHLEIWWDKSARDNMVEIAKILKGLSSAYVAFQTFDPVVLDLIGRRNISLERLKNISQSLSKYSERLRTDILLGLPGETIESHLNSLNTAFDYGFDSIGGGEVRLLMGSELESDISRKKYGINTKYRLVQEGFGIYRGQLVFELEESIRSTKWISEEEMLKLRIIRAMFFGSVTIGEFLPLMKYLKYCDIKIMDFFKNLIKAKNNDRYVDESIDWLFNKACGEWFNSQEDAEHFFSNENNLSELLANPTIKLNFDFISNLVLSVKKYRSFCRYMLDIIIRFFPQCDNNIAQELLELCENRNYIIRCLKGKYQINDSIKLSGDTISILEKIGFLPKGDDRKNISNSLRLKMDEVDAKFIENYIKEKGGKINTQTISILIETVPNIYMKLGY
ncbi:MAG: hypothetical protein CEN91_412 [Candidatus Berkelbacteria bacterium Licking1014_85]|uniref:Uncharacterized protein n=1 Tax=Candidatus Berkelbacteria bacterium Licking1014_85 TaxID=2017148 RepID=A0A554LI44_9BACT|nr:MAG: hypothetical protein CEN91_412 [Candidatus Berkelbacteria bacterium Licking1014_85]